LEESPVADEPVARSLWRTLEPYHGMIYFAPEAVEEYARLGTTHPRTGYFASRAAAMGAVPASVVIATFYGFHPRLVTGAMASAWELASAPEWIEARYLAADRALRRMLGDTVCEGGPMVEVAGILRHASSECSLVGRPLFAGHASLEWPDAPHLAVWHGITLLREFRGDGHLSVLTSHGVAPCESLVMHAASGAVSADILRTSRAWSEIEWQAAGSALASRGWLESDRTFTVAGEQHQAMVESATDALAAAPWAHLDADSIQRVRQLGREWSKTIVASGVFVNAFKS
jgi:hypothetical protein